MRGAVSMVPDLVRKLTWVTVRPCRSTPDVMLWNSGGHASASVSISSSTILQISGSKITRSIIRPVDSMPQSGTVGAALGDQPVDDLLADAGDHLFAAGGLPAHELSSRQPLLLLRRGSRCVPPAWSWRRRGRGAPAAQTPATPPPTTRTSVSSFIALPPACGSWTRSARHPAAQSPVQPAACVLASRPSSRKRSSGVARSAAFG